MGMYTELVVSAQISDVPEVIAVLQYMAGEGPKPSELPDHPLFSCERWERLFKCCSYYFVPMSVVKLRYDDISKHWCLVSRADLKNYDSEIEKFIDWIRPYVEASGMFAYSRYEESREPTIYYKEDDGATPDDIRDEGVPAARQRRTGPTDMPMADR